MSLYRTPAKPVNLLMAAEFGGYVVEPVEGTGCTPRLDDNLPH